MASWLLIIFTISTVACTTSEEVTVQPSSINTPALPPNHTETFSDIQPSTTTSIQNVMTTITATPYFPVQSEPADGGLDVLLHGTLVIENNFLGVAGPEDIFEVIIWPYGYTLSIQEESLQVLDRKGQTVARLGEYFEIGGGSVPENKKAALAAAYGVPEDFMVSFFLAAAD